MSSSALNESFIEVGPSAIFTSILVDGGEPQRLTPLLKEVKVATGTDDAWGVGEGEEIDYHYVEL